MAQLWISQEVDVSAGWVYTGTVYQPNPSVFPTPVQDLTGGAATLNISPNVGSATVLVLSSPMNITLGGVLGTYTINLTPAASLATFTTLLAQAGLTRSYIGAAFALTITGITVNGIGGQALRPLEGRLLFGQSA